MFYPLPGSPGVDSPTHVIDAENGGELWAVGTYDAKLERMTVRKQLQHPIANHFKSGGVPLPGFGYYFMATGGDSAQNPAHPAPDGYRLLQVGRLHSFPFASKLDRTHT